MKLWRILVISILAPLCGIAFYLASEAVAPEADASSPLRLWVVILVLVWLVSAGVSFVSGMLLHLAIVHRHPPAGVVFLLFVLSAAAVTWLFSLSPGITTHLQFLGIGTGASAWAMYCYGPFKLWQGSASGA